MSATDFDVYSVPKYDPPKGALKADHKELAHNNTYGPLPLFYVDKSFYCLDCGSYEIWKAKQQKWWYEIVKGNIGSQAVKCLKCRKADQAVKETQQRHMEAMANKEPHPNEAFFKKKF